MQEIKLRDGRVVEVDVPDDYDWSGPEGLKRQQEIQRAFEPTPLQQAYDVVAPIAAGARDAANYVGGRAANVALYGPGGAAEEATPLAEGVAKTVIP
jgi:hypothetical protein